MRTSLKRGSPIISRMIATVPVSTSDEPATRAARPPGPLPFPAAHAAD